jgi:hypothetical protein
VFGRDVDNGYMPTSFLRVGTEGSYVRPFPLRERDWAEELEDADPFIFFGYVNFVWVIGMDDNQGVSSRVTKRVSKWLTGKVDSSS